MLVYSAAPLGVTVSTPWAQSLDLPWVAGLLPPGTLKSCYSLTGRIPSASHLSLVIG